MPVIYRSLRARESEEQALVLRAMGIEHVLERGFFGWRLEVPADEAPRAREQLRLYELENRARVAPTAPAAGRPGALAGAIGWTFVLFFVFWLQSRYAFGIDWLTAGRLDVALIRSGEWWRVLTALTLHVDAPHLFVNIGFGAAFGTLMAREIGGGFAWLLILAGGAVGNLMNVIVQQPEHTAIGASTSVFAALGLLAAYLWTARRLIRDSWARRLAPVIGAVLLLAWLGTGDERTDIVAHLTGFLAGFAIGAVLGRRLDTQDLDRVRQPLLGVVSVIGLIVAWGFAIA